MMISSPSENRKRYELVFVITVLLLAGLIHNFVPYKMSFLNLYALPVLMAAYYLDIRKTLLGTVACILLVLFNAQLSPQSFLRGMDILGLYINLAAWGCLLLLSAILVDHLKCRLLGELDRGKRLGHEILALTEFDRQREKLLQSVTHDLKAPLNAVQAYVQLMLKGLSGPITQTQRRQLQIIRSGTEELAHAIDEILDLSRLQAKRMEFNKAHVSIEDILRSVCELQKATAQSFKIDLKFSAEAGLPAVWADRQQIARVITNLIFNAFKFTPEGGTVEISARREAPASVLVQVTDTGVGIPKDKLELVFDRFAQVTDTRKKARMAGTGLGLTITKEIVEAHHGVIWAESAPSQGSVFRFTLPIESPVTS